MLGLLYLVLKGLANPANDQLTAAKWVPFLEWSSWTNYLIPGLIGTLQAAAISVVLSVVAGRPAGHGPALAAGAVCGSSAGSSWSSSAPCPC